MKSTLRITLLLSFLMLFVFPANAIVHHNKSAKSSISKKKVSFKKITKKIKKRIKSFSQYSDDLILEKKKFGKVGSITLFFILATAVFTVLKLTGVIAWSWFWVLSPMIFYIGLILLIVLIGLFAVLALKEANE